MKVVRENEKNPKGHSSSAGSPKRDHERSE